MARFDVINNISKKLNKLFGILLRRDYRAGLYMGVAAAVEHEAVLKNIPVKTVVDIGANRGQFALVARYSYPTARIFSFEPLPEPADLYAKVFSSDNSVLLHYAAIGPEEQYSEMHVSARDDSSSLLPISKLQGEIFPGTDEVGTHRVHVAPLDAFLNSSDINEPALLKLDVQGFEMEALIGCESLLSCFQWVYCECSFVELYSGQKLAADVIEWLASKGFHINGMYNPSYDRCGMAVQADFLFSRVV